jgi:hypothetical protein
MFLHSVPHNRGEKIKKMQRGLAALEPATPRTERSDLILRHICHETSCPRLGQALLPLILYPHFFVSMGEVFRFALKIIVAMVTRPHRVSTYTYIHLVAMVTSPKKEHIGVRGCRG